MSKTMKMMLAGAMMFVSACITVVPESNGTTNSTTTTNIVEVASQTSNLAYLPLSFYTNTTIRIGNEARLRFIMSDKKGKEFNSRIDFRCGNLELNGEDCSLGFTNKAKFYVNDWDTIIKAGSMEDQTITQFIDERIAYNINGADFTVDELDVDNILVGGEPVSLVGHKHQLKDIEGLSLIGLNALNEIDKAKNLEQLKSAMKDFVKDITNLKGE